MKKIFSSVSALLLVAAGVLGQETKPVPKPTPPDNDVVKISTSLIQIDVSVTDAKGKPITDLRPDEIEIYENGEKQNISNFSFVSSARETTQKPASTDKIAIPIPQGTLRPEQIRRTIALVVDDLSLSFESAYQTRRSLKKFVDEQMQDGDLVAIIRTGAGIGALQQFTSDKRILLAAIEKVKWNPLGSGGISAFAPIEPPAIEGEEATEDSSEESTAQADTATALDDFRTQGFVTGTLGALRYIVTGMGGLPGRKSVILFSDGFRLLETNESGFSEAGVVMDFLRALIEQANRSSVVIYTIDARGLVYTGITAADSITSSSQLESVPAGRSAQLFDTQSGLSFLAEETGGLAIKNNNDLSGGVRRVLEDQSYYLIGYEPDADTFDAAKRKYNKLEVKVLRTGAKVRYRSGFFNVADKPSTTSAPAAVLSPTAQLESALVSPFAVGGISLRLNALFGNDVKNGSFVRSLIHISAGDLKFTDEKDGTKKAVFDVLAMSFGDNGQIVDQLAKGYTMTAKPQDMKRLLETGFVYSFTFPIKKPGAFQYRVALRDFQSGKVGSASQFIEVPNLKKYRLTVSSVVLENLSESEWEKLNSPLAPPSNRGEILVATALRKAKLGSILRYGFEIYNAKLDSGHHPNLTTKVRVFREGKLVLDGVQKQIDASAQTDLTRVKASGAIALGGKMLPGDYILQIIVTDILAKAGQKVATQFVQFEVVE